MPTAYVYIRFPPNPALTAYVLAHTCMHTCTRTSPRTHTHSHAHAKPAPNPQGIVLVVWHPLLYQEPTDVQYHEVRTKEVLYSYVEGIERYQPPNDWQVCA